MSDIFKLKERLFTKNEFNVTYQDPTARLTERETEFAKKALDIRTDVHRMCVNCQIRQRMKYDGLKQIDPETGEETVVKGFMVPCNFVPKELSPEMTQAYYDLVAQGTDPARAEKLLMATVDPVVWAELMFGFHDGDETWQLRDYQKEQLRCNAQRYVLREGRRCVIDGTKILMEDGSTKLIEDIKIGDRVVNHNNGPSVGEVQDVFDNGIQTVYEVSLQGGTKIEITSNHPLLSRTRESYRHKYSDSSFRSIDDGLKVGDSVATLAKYDVWGKTHNPELCGFLGYMITDGSCTKDQSPKFTNNNLSYIKEVEDFVHSRWPDRECKRYLKGNGQDTIFVAKEGKKPNPVRLYMQSINLDGKKADSKHIDFINEFDRESVARFLNRMWAGDGSVSVRSKGRRENDWSVDISLTTASKEIAYGLESLLHKIGVYGCVEEQIRKSPASDFVGLYYKYRIQEMQSCKRFLEFTGPIFGKEKQSELALDITKNAKNYHVEELDGWRWARIIAIKEIGIKHTYDIEVPNGSSFIGNGIVNHNSGKTFIVALKLLFLIFNRKIESRDSEGETLWTGPSIMIVTPFQSQLTNVFNEMEKLLKKNESLAGYITKQGGASLYTKTPNFKMEFSNGGLINGFVTGTGVRGDGAGGGALRGQSAHVIYLDEMDLIEDEVIEKVVMPILLSDLKGEVTLIGTSTPIGKRSFFYEWCVRSPDFKEDHFPSTVLPQWAKIKGMILSKTTKEGIMTEYMAEFIDSEYGVFKANYVQRSRRNYTYYDISEQSWWMENLGVSPYSTDIVKCIGIDWNKNAGTEFCVVAYIPSRRIYILLDSINVPSSEISGQKWKETVIMLNMKWKPDYIYADEGYGHTIIEDLLFHANALIGKKHKNALDLETIRLRDRLKAFNFSSKVELRNPIDGTIIEKPSKEFLVENTQRIFEDNGSKGSGIVWMPEGEEVLIAQMQNYVVQKINKSSGKPVFGPDNEKIGDHRLDAFMLALAGIEIETGLFGSANMIGTDPIMLQEDKKKEDRLTPLSIISRKSAPNGFTGNTRDIRLLNNRGVEFNPDKDEFSKKESSFFKRNLPKTNNRRSF